MSHEVNEQQTIPSEFRPPMFGDLLWLDPFQVEADEEINVRPFSTANTSGSDAAEMEKLVKSIEANGQETAITVRPNGEDGTYKLVTGSRRLQAIRIINAGRSEDEMLRVKAILSTSEDPYRAAFDENDKRQSMSPMDRAMNFRHIRDTRKLKGAKGDKEVAEYFGVNVATVIQYKKLEALSATIQQQVHDGRLTMDAALVIANAGKEIKDPKERADYQDQMLVDAEREEVAKKQVEGEVEAEVVVATKAKTKTRKAKGGKAGISASSVKKAARKAGEKLSRSRKDILEWFVGENGPAYKEHVTDFLAYFVKWADGNGTDRTLGEKFRESIGKAGMKSQTEMKQATAVRVAKNKK